MTTWARNILATFACTVIAVCVVVEVVAAVVVCR